MMEERWTLEGKTALVTGGAGCLSVHARGVLYHRTMHIGGRGNDCKYVLKTWSYYSSIR